MPKASASVAVENRLAGSYLHELTSSLSLSLFPDGPRCSGILYVLNYVLTPYHPLILYKFQIVNRSVKYLDCLIDVIPCFTRTVPQNAPPTAQFPNPGVPHSLEFLLCSNTCLILLIYLWRTLPEIKWVWAGQRVTPGPGLCTCLLLLGRNTKKPVGNEDVEGKCLLI